MQAGRWRGGRSQRRGNTRRGGESGWTVAEHKTALGRRFLLPDSAAEQRGGPVSYKVRVCVSVCVGVCVKMILLLFLPELFCDCFRRIKAVVVGLSSVRRQKCERPPGCFLLAFSLFNASCLESLWIKTPKNVPLCRRYISRPN